MPSVALIFLIMHFDYCSGHIIIVLHVKSAFQVVGAIFYVRLYNVFVIVDDFFQCY